MLSLLGLQLSAGITTARLRRELQARRDGARAPPLAAEVHDGLAQYLALARRELALPEPDRERLTEAVDAAHRLVRARLQELSADAPADLRQAIEAAARRARASVRVCGRGEAGPEAVTLAARIVSEALANADAHANATSVEIDYAADDERLDLTVQRRRRRVRPRVRAGRRGRAPRPDRHARARARPRRRMRHHFNPRQRNAGDSMDSALESAFPGGACPHVAMLLSTAQEVAPTLASFYALGAKRNGWLFHRSLAGTPTATARRSTEGRPRRRRLEAEGRMVFGEITLDISVEDYVHAWEPELEAALARGFDAAWWARFPIGPDAEIIERSVEYDRAWDDHFHDRPCVSLCLFIVGDVERDHRAAQLALTHDTVLSG